MLVIVNDIITIYTYTVMISLRFPAFIHIPQICIITYYHWLMNILLRDKFIIYRWYHHNYHILTWYHYELFLITCNSLQIMYDTIIIYENTVVVALKFPSFIYLQNYSFCISLSIYCCGIIKASYIQKRRRRRIRNYLCHLSFHYIKNDL